MIRAISPLQNISASVTKLRANSNIYIIKLNSEIVVIDAGDRSERNVVEQFLGKIIDPAQVKKVFFTHLHYDHIGNFDLFPNAEFHASAVEIDAFNKNKDAATLNPDIAEKFAVHLNPFPADSELEIIDTPGHTAGSVCFWYEKESVLFTGDTIFRKKLLGRTDLPTSMPEKMPESLMKLAKYNPRHICPGHDY
ncbi:MBL fold metallo-hydrolase [Candidatus Woesearchaeota archaeon]|nr:MBL fold metallo-hydrolase [Candidatus Woesearchaeota archaeon]